MIMNADGIERVYIIVLDSCRFDTFKTGSFPSLRRYGKLHRARAVASWTVPAHYSIAQGFLPETSKPEPFANRFVRSVFRFRSDRYLSQRQKPLFLLDGDSIFEGFSKLGWAAIGSVAMSWLAKPPFRDYFTHFQESGDIEKQLRFVWKKAANRRAIALVNLGETHFPYAFGNISGAPSAVRRAVKRYKPGTGGAPGSLMRALKRRQIEAARYCGQALQEYIEKNESSSRALFIITADHGECFGEEGLFGHAFWAPPVFDVPLMIFRR